MPKLQKGNPYIPVRAGARVTPISRERFGNFGTGTVSARMAAIFTTYRGGAYSAMGNHIRNRGTPPHAAARFEILSKFQFARAEN
jgi:hypothetical protein